MTYNICHCDHCRLENARKLATYVIRYFGKENILPALDGDIAIRDMALKFLGFSKSGSGRIPDGIWKEIAEDEK